MLRLDSILASFLGEVDGLSGLTERFAINTDTLPLADSLPKGDARLGLKHFPRAGDYGAVDAAHPKALRSAKFPDSGVRDFTYKHGPTMRMVISIPSKGAVEGVNILPGGQSSLTDSPHFADQIKLWLENKTEKMRFTPSDVVAGATGREVFVPASTR